VSKHDGKSIETLNRVPGVGWPEDEKGQQRFYLFAGMGGKPARRKHKLIVQWAIVVGFLVSAAVAFLLYITNRVNL
jgi:hypothetical protein